MGKIAKGKSDNRLLFCQNGALQALNSAMGSKVGSWLAENCCTPQVFLRAKSGPFGAFRRPSEECAVLSQLVFWLKNKLQPCFGGI